MRAVASARWVELQSDHATLQPARDPERVILADGRKTHRELRDLARSLIQAVAGGGELRFNIRIGRGRGRRLRREAHARREQRRATDHQNSGARRTRRPRAGELPCT
jgi:hypothetical protein